MATNDKEQYLMLANTMEEMQKYLSKWQEACEILPEEFQNEEKFYPMEKLSTILDGLTYYLKLLETAGNLLLIDQTAAIWEKVSILSMAADIHNFSTGIFAAAENEDYSLVADLVEYELLPLISVAQQLLKAIQQCCTERS